LSRANLSHCDFTGAVLKGADLSASLVVGTSFLEADLNGADLSGVDLSSCDLRGARGVAAALDTMEKKAG